ncbi:MAG: hypothetical protein HZB16_11715 [Armatimonadetes bacterium]|nr:hypothetical protein [Armatimonadota bacterium]
MVKHTAESYREAALAHLKLALSLHHDLAAYGAAHYWAGLAVECMLRAWRRLAHAEFDSRHDLVALARAARFHQVVGPDLAPLVSTALGEVAVRWSNDHRYRPARLIERWLRDQGLDRHVAGDKLKYSSTCIIDAAQTIVQMGARRWPSTTN